MIWKKTKEQIRIIIEHYKRTKSRVMTENLHTNLDNVEKFQFYGEVQRIE